MTTPIYHILIIYIIDQWTHSLIWFDLIWSYNRIGGVMVSKLASSAVDRGFEPRSGQTKEYKFGIFCFSAKHAALRRKSNVWLSRNQDNMCEWGDMSIRGLLLQWASTIKKIQLSVLVQYIADLITISSQWYNWKIAELAFSPTHPKSCTL
jgi:hypothetical protein